MANLNALKNLFSKLKPAAKTVANYGDDVAKAAVNYGDDVAQMAFANADDLAAVTAQTDDIANIISKENPILNSAPVEDPVLWDTDYIEWYDDNGINTDFTLNGVRTIPENTDDLIAHLNNMNAGLDSFEYRYQNAVSPKHKLSELFDDGYRGFVRPDRQRLYDHAIAHGANRKKLDSLLKTVKYNPRLYSDYPDLFREDLPF